VFFVLYPPPDAAAQMARLALSSREKYRLTGEPTGLERLHVSLQGLCSFGRLTPATFAEICEAVGGIAMPSFVASFNCAKSFGRETGPLVLCGDEGVTGFMMLRTEVATALRKIGFRTGSARYEPHVTLFYEPCAIPEHAVEEIRWTVRELVLACSLRGQHRHVALARWSLRAVQ
jgi:2'-5' RNA ligase